MQKINKRSVEATNLFNPVYCSILLRESIEGYESKSSMGMPYPILFLVLPIIMHKHTRESLPKRTITYMHKWLHENPEVLIGFPERTRKLVPFTKEAIIYAMHNNLINIDENGFATITNKKIKSPSWPKGSETLVSKERAKFLGTWLSMGGDVSTIYISWGVRP